MEIDSFDGKTKTILNYAAPVLDDKGDVDGAVIVNLDITERELDRQKMAQQLDELNRWYKATIGREERVIQLKQEVNTLLRLMHQPERYFNTDPSSGERTNNIQE